VSDRELLVGLDANKNASQQDDSDDYVIEDSAFNYFGGNVEHIFILLEKLEFESNTIAMPTFMGRFARIIGRGTSWILL